MREEMQVLSKDQIKESFGHTSFDSREALKNLNFRISQLNYRDIQV